MDLTRNLGLVSGINQNELGRTKVLVCGVGGDGGLIAELLLRLGVGCGEGGEIRLTDPDTFGSENFNRQAFSNLATLGRNKATVVAEALRQIIGESANIIDYPEGVTAENVHQLMEGVDVVIDETDYEKHWIGVIIAREARRLGIPVFTGLNVGFGGEYTSFFPDGYTLERFLGLPEGASIDKIQKMPVGLSRWVVHIPPYAQYDIFRQIQSEGRTVPSVSPGVAITAGNTATQVYRYLTGLSVVQAPHVGWDDAMQERRGIVRWPLWSFLWSLAVMRLRSQLGRNPAAE